MSKNIFITERDKEVFSLLNKIKVIETKALYWLINNKPKIETFLKRLKFLKEKWYIENIKNVFSSDKIFSLCYNKENLDEIEYKINETIYKSKIVITNALYNHEYKISQSLLYIKKQIEEKEWKEIIIRDSFMSQYQIYELKNSNIWLNYKKIFSKILIPDWILHYWNSSYLIEVEINNSYQKFKQKLTWYKKMMLYMESINKNSDIFKNELILYIFVGKHKIKRYKSIIKEVWIKNIEFIVKNIDEI